MILNPDQQLVLRQLTEADARYREVRDELTAQMRAELAARIEQTPEAARRKDLARRAHEAGVPMIQIAHVGLGTKARATARELIGVGK